MSIYISGTSFTDFGERGQAQRKRFQRLVTERVQVTVHLWSTGIIKRKASILLF